MRIETQATFAAADREIETHVQCLHCGERLLTLASNRHGGRRMRCYGARVFSSGAAVGMAHVHCADCGKITPIARNLLPGAPASPSALVRKARPSVARMATGDSPPDPTGRPTEPADLDSYPA